MAERRTAENGNTPVSRQQHKEQREVKEELSNKNYAVRSILLMILRILIVLIFVVIAAVIGAMVGYGVIGDGKVMDVLEPSTWTHVFDIMNGTEE